MIRRMFPFLIFSSVMFSCQQELYIYANRIRISYPDYTVEGTVIDAKKLKNFDSDVYYYWSDRSKIFKTQGSGSGYLLDGEFFAYYPSGQLMERGLFDKGIKVGSWTKWNELGEIIEQVNWKKGMKNGNALTVSNETTVRTTYKDDLKHGKERIFVNGKLERKIRYRHGEAIIRNRSREEEDGNTKDIEISTDISDAAADSTKSQVPFLKKLFKSESKGDPKK